MFSPEQPDAIRQYADIVIAGALGEAPKSYGRDLVAEMMRHKLEVAVIAGELTIAPQTEVTPAAESIVKSEHKPEIVLGYTDDLMPSINARNDSIDDQISSLEDLLATRKAKKPAVSFWQKHLPATAPISESPAQEHVLPFETKVEPEPAADQVDGAGAIDEILEPLAVLPHMKLKPATEEVVEATDLAKLIEQDEAVQAFLQSPDVRDKAIKQLKADMVAGDSYDEKGNPVYSDLQIFEVTIEVNRARDVVKQHYLAVKKDYNALIKIKEVRDLFQRYGEVANLVRYFRRLTYDLPLSDIDLGDGASLLSANQKAAKAIWYDQQPMIPTEYAAIDDGELGELDERLTTTSKAGA